MKVAALDLGSNTFLCLVAEVSQQKIVKVYDDQVQIVRLGQGLSQNKNFHPEALRRADQCLNFFSKIILQQKPDQVLAMATSAARDAENSEELFSLGRKYQIPIEIIAGEKEAQITYAGATSSLTRQENKKILVLDIGGGSTEFIFGQGQEMVQGKSFDIGCVRLTEKYIQQQPTPDEQIQKALHEIDSCVEQAQKMVPPNFQIDEIVAVAGTPTSLAAAEIGKFDPEKIESYSLNLKSLENWLDKLTASTTQQKIKMGIPEGRADVILIGVLILKQVLEKFKQKEIKVSTRGVRYGIALEMDRRHHPDL